MDDLIIHSGNETLQLWKSRIHDGKVELMIGSGGDWPEEQLIMLDKEQLSRLVDWVGICYG